MTAVLAPRPRSARPRQRAIAFAERLVLQVCRASPDPTYLKRLRTQLTRQGIRRAVAQHDTPAMFNWLVEVASYQGIADTIAWAYMQQHGRVRWADLQAAFSSGPKCPKLASFEAFSGCRYRKASRTCAHPEHFPGCPLPPHPLRKGSLNQAAYALYLFLRDECRGDFVAWIDAQLLAADRPSMRDRAQRMREALLRPLARVHGLGPKVASMAFAELLLGADPKRERWLTTGASLIVVDSLVHNWLHRTGILQRLDAEHAYGPTCYRPGGCAEIIETLATRIDAQQFNCSFPAVFPRYLQKAIWSFCAENGLGICNGNRIDDNRPCADHTCCLSSNCRRIALRSAN